MTGFSAPSLYAVQPVAQPHHSTDQSDAPYKPARRVPAVVPLTNCAAPVSVVLKTTAGEPTGPT